jgi:hypothetical protein
VIDKLVTPPHASHAGTSAESENSHDIDNISTVLDDSGSLGSFLDATLARSRQIENTETPNATTPVNSPELDSTFKKAYAFLRLSAKASEAEGYRSVSAQSGQLSEKRKKRSD